MIGFFKMMVWTINSLSSKNWDLCIYSGERVNLQYTWKGLINIVQKGLINIIQKGLINIVQKGLIQYT